MSSSPNKRQKVVIKLHLTKDVKIKLINLLRTPVTIKEAAGCMKNLGLCFFLKQYSTIENAEIDQEFWETGIVEDNDPATTLKSLLQKCLPKHEFENVCLCHFVTYTDNDERLLFIGDEGLATYFAKLKRDEIVITNQETRSGYIYRESEKLWVKASGSDIRFTIGPTLRKAIQGYIDTDDKDSQSNDAKKENTKRPALVKLETKLQYDKNISGIFARLVVELTPPNLEAWLTRLDSVSYLLPIKKNKVIDLRTKEVRERCKTDYFTFFCPVDYTECNEYPIAYQFFRSICSNDDQMVQYLQELLGYCLTGEMNERSFYILTGSGKNGKSVLSTIMQSILKKYYVACSHDCFMETDKKNGNGAATPELIPLEKTRVALFSEGKKGQTLDSARIKRITGGDPIVGRPLYKEQVSFIPFCKLLMMTNNNPIFDVDDQAMKDRIIMIPFTNRFERTIENDAYVRSLSNQHLNEMFSFIVQGSCRWYQHKQLKLPPSGFEAMKEYIGENDSVQQFFESQCTLGDELVAEFGAIGLAYQTWTRANNISNRLNTREFGTKMKKKFKPGQKTINGTRKHVYIGISLN
jgi:P4 family phage/plasmid primase-like protien